MLKMTANHICLPLRVSCTELEARCENSVRLPRVLRVISKTFCRFGLLFALGGASLIATVTFSLKESHPDRKKAV